VPRACRPRSKSGRRGMRVAKISRMEGFQHCRVTQDGARGCATFCNNRRLTRTTEPPILGLASSKRVCVTASQPRGKTFLRMTPSGPALALGLLLAGGATAVTAAPYLLVSGRWDNTILVIDLAKAIEPSNDGSSNAIVNRLRVTPDIAPNTSASGQPVNVVLSPIAALRTSSTIPDPQRPRPPPISSTATPAPSPSSTSPRRSIRPTA